MADISKEELEKEIAKILEYADLSKTSVKMVRQKLEKIFKVELTDKRSLIDRLVMSYVNNMPDSSEEEVGGRRGKGGYYRADKLSPALAELSLGK